MRRFLQITNRLEPQRGLSLSPLPFRGLAVGDGSEGGVLTDPLPSSITMDPEGMAAAISRAWSVRTSISWFVR